MQHGYYFPGAGDRILSNRHPSHGRGSSGLGLLMTKQALAQELVPPPRSLQHRTQAPWFFSEKQSSTLAGVFPGQGLDGCVLRLGGEDDVAHPGRSLRLREEPIGCPGGCRDSQTRTASMYGWLLEFVNGFREASDPIVQSAVQQLQSWLWLFSRAPAETP
jgi:hypothetical protein